jgi:hypothetical protein
MEKEFVTYELALRMKALGFDEPCFGYFCNDRRDCKLEFIPVKLAKNWNGIESNLDESPIYNGRNKKEVKESLDERNLLFLWTSAPTWQSAFKWLENKYNIYGIPKPILGSKNGYDSFPILGWDFDSFMTNLATENSYYMGYPIGEWFTATMERFEEGGTLSDYNIEPMTKEDAQKACLGQLITIAEYKNSRIQE